MEAFLQSYLSTVGVIMDINAPEHDIPWSYDAHSVNLTVWSRMDDSQQNRFSPYLTYGILSPVIIQYCVHA